MIASKGKIKRFYGKLNVAILNKIKRSLVYSHKKTYQDVDYLAGSWSAHEKKNFEINTRSFADIDKDLWS